MKILDRYIIKEFVPPFLLGLLLFTFVLLINKLYRLTELVVNKGVSIWDIFRLISYIMPSFLTLTIPMAVLLASLVAFGRMSTVSEITAFKATGFSLYRLMAPVMALSVVAMLATAYFSLYLGPMKARSFKKDLFYLAKSRAAISIDEEVFNDSVKNVIIYAQKTPAPNEMEGVFISDERDPKQPYVIIARKGSIDVDVATGLAHVNLENGSIHKKGNKPGSYQEIDFDTNRLSINLYEKFFKEDGPKKSKREMSLAELKETARAISSSLDYRYSMLTEYYKRFTIPLACLVFGVIGPPLGLYSRRSGKSAGTTVALVVFALYYLLMKGGEDLASGGRMPALVAALLPNIVIGLLGAYILTQTAAEKRLEPGRFLKYLRRLRRARRAGAYRRSGRR